MPRRNPRPPYGGPQVMGPGQGILPLGPRDDLMGTFRTGQRGLGPDLPPDVGPFEQTGTDIMNLFNTGSTAPHWSGTQMSQMYNMPLYKLLGKTRQGQAGTAITSAEIDRMYRNVSGGLGYYAGQLQDMFGGSAGAPQFSVPPGVAGQPLTNRPLQPGDPTYTQHYPNSPGPRPLDPYGARDARTFPPQGGNINQQVPGGAARPVMGYPTNIIDPSLPGYPTTEPVAPPYGGGFVPGPGNPAYPQPQDPHGPGGVPGFAQGGDFMTNGPQMIMVGDNPGGVERVQVDPMNAPPAVDPNFDPNPFDPNPPDFVDPTDPANNPRPPWQTPRPPILHGQRPPDPRLIDYPVSGPPLTVPFPSGIQNPPMRPGQKGKEWARNKLLNWLRAKRKNRPIGPPSPLF